MKEWEHENFIIKLTKIPVSFSNGDGRMGTGMTIGAGMKEWEHASNKNYDIVNQGLVLNHS